MTPIKYRNKLTGKEFWLNCSHQRMIEQGQLYPDQHKPTHDEMIEYGYYLIVLANPAPDPATEKVGTEWAYVGEECWLITVAKTQQEQDDFQAAVDAEIARRANEAVHGIKINSPYWIGLIDVTDQQIDNKIEAAFPDVKQQDIIKDLSKAIRDRAQADQALNNLGFFDF